MDSQSRRQLGWYWLLAIPFVGLLFPVWYARVEPTWLGFPFFYWYQFLWLLIASSITALVYARTR